MYQDRPTVMLVVHGGYPSRYLLRTDVLKTLLDADVNIVILTPNAGEEYFQREFASPRVCLEPYRLEECAAYRDASRIQRTLKLIRHATLNGRGDMTTLNYNFSVATHTGGNGFAKRAYKSGLGVIVGAARRSRWLRRAIVTLESRMFEGGFHRDIFEKYQPDLVVTTSFGYFDFDQFVMREARRVGARSLAVILSWDNPTSWGMGAAQADAAVVWTEAMKQELVTYHDFPADRIQVGGVAHFDTYFRALKISRGELFGAVGSGPLSQGDPAGKSCPDTISLERNHHRDNCSGNRERSIGSGLPAARPSSSYPFPRA